jgi:hypothetical protein
MLPRLFGAGPRGSSTKAQMGGGGCILRRNGARMEGGFSMAGMVAVRLPQMVMIPLGIGILWTKNPECATMINRYRVIRPMLVAPKEMEVDIPMVSIDDLGVGATTSMS